MEQLTDLKAILHSKRANIYYLEMCRVLQKDGSLKIETSKGDRIISADDIQKFLRENDVIEEWDIKEDKEENREENKNINVKYTINTIRNKKVEIEGKVYVVNEDGSVTTAKERISPGILFVMLCAGKAKLIEEEK